MGGLAEIDSTLLIGIAFGFVVVIGLVLTILLKPKKLKEENQVTQPTQEPSTKIEIKETKKSEVPNQKNIKNTTTSIETPHIDYGVFDTTRAKEEFDMSDEEIVSFVEELKQQIEEELPFILEYLTTHNYKELKSSIHKIKGSAVNLGNNGIAKLLFEFNHYLSEGKQDEKELKLMYEDVLYYKNLI